MSNSLFRECRLADSEGDGRWPYVNDDGAFHGFGTPLLRQVPTNRGTVWEPRPPAELDHLLRIGYGAPVDVAGISRHLAVVARALNDGNPGLAATALVLTGLPPLPSPARATAMAEADRLSKYSPLQPRLPGGRHGGGRWVIWDNRGALDGFLIDAGYSPEALRLWRPLRDAIAREGYGAELVQNALTEIFTNVPLSEMPADVRAVLTPPKDLLDLLPAVNPARFTSWQGLRRYLDGYLGPPPDGYVWHHINEQSVADEPGQPIDVTHRWILTTQNVVLIPTLTHLMITADMNTKGLRYFVRRHSLKAQYKIGIDLLRDWGAMK